MIVTKVANRYASALFEEADSRNMLKDVAADMQRISRSISGSRELQVFLKSQIISREMKIQTLAALFDDDVTDLTRQFMRLVLEKRREEQLFGITVSFDKLYKKKQGEVDIEVFIVHRPDTKQNNALKKALETKTAGKVNLLFNEDPSLIGGMAVRIEDTVIDGTLKHKLQQLEASFQQTGM